MLMHIDIQIHQFYLVSYRWPLAFSQKGFRKKKNLEISFGELPKIRHSHHFTESKAQRPGQQRLIKKFLSKDAPTPSAVIAPTRLICLPHLPSLSPALLSNLQDFVWVLTLTFGMFWLLFKFWNVWLQKTFFKIIQIYMILAGSD